MPVMSNGKAMNGQARKPMACENEFFPDSVMNPANRDGDLLKTFPMSGQIE